MNKAKTNLRQGQKGKKDVFSKVFFKSPNVRTKRDHAQLNAFIDPAVDRYKALENEEKQEDFKCKNNTIAQQAEPVASQKAAQRRLSCGLCE